MMNRKQRFLLSDLLFENCSIAAGKSLDQSSLMR